MNLDLALDVSWRRVTGPIATVRLIDYGPGAIETATALCMVIEGDLAHLSARTPDLAEAMMTRAETPEQRAAPIILAKLVKQRDKRIKGLHEAVIR